MSDPRAEWGKELLKEVKAMAEDIKTHREETQTTRADFLVFQGKIETTLTHLDPRDLSAQLKGLSNFETRLNTEISAAKWWGKFLVGLAVTLVLGVLKLAVDLGGQTAEIANHGKLLDRIEKAVPRGIEPPAKGVEDGLASVGVRLGVLEQMARDVKTLAVRDSAARSFVFTLTKDNMVSGAPKAVRFQVALDEAAAERYGQIASSFPDHMTKVTLRELTPGLRGVSVADENFLQRFVAAVSVTGQVSRGVATFTFEPRIDAGDEILKKFVQGLAAKPDEFARVSLKVYL